MGVRFDSKGNLIADDGSPVTPTVEEVEDVASFTDTSTIDDESSLCEVCGEPIAYSGRGRKPKYHPEHRPTAPKRSGSSPQRSGAIRNEAALREALLTRYMQIGSLLAMVHPAYGMGVKQKAEEAVNADIEYARVSPAFRRTLEAMLEKTALGAVIAVHAAMLGPVVVGEQAKRMRKKATQPVKETPVRGEQPPTPRPSQAPPSNVRYGDFPTTETDVAPESINAGALPGMPG